MDMMDELQILLRDFSIALLQHEVTLRLLEIQAEEIFIELDKLEENIAKKK